MFGPSLLVAPIVEENPAIWHVYLPENKGGWYDFFTGKKMHVSSGTIDIPVSLENIPVFVKAGTILPLAENCQHTGEVADVAWEIRIYQEQTGSLLSMKMKELIISMNKENMLLFVWNGMIIKIN